VKPILAKLVTSGFLLCTIPLSTAAAQSEKFQDLLEAAKKEATREQTFLVYASNPKEARTREALFEAFKENTIFPISDSNGCLCSRAKLSPVSSPKPGPTEVVLQFSWGLPRSPWNSTDRVCWKPSIG
jgi:hypothetical protein